jgi:hypothetical protein
LKGHIFEADGIGGEVCVRCSRTRRAAEERKLFDCRVIYVRRRRKIIHLDGDDEEFKSINAAKRRSRGELQLANDRGLGRGCLKAV